MCGLKAFLTKRRTSNLSSFHCQFEFCQNDKYATPYRKNKAKNYIKKGGILKRGGATRASNVMSKGGTPKARRGGSVGRNGIL